MSAPRRSFAEGLIRYVTLPATLAAAYFYGLAGGFDRAPRTEVRVVAHGMAHASVYAAPRVAVGVPVMPAVAGDRYVVVDTWSAGRAPIATTRITVVRPARAPRAHVHGSSF